MADKEISVIFEKETKRTYRYKTDDMAQTYYFPKEWFTDFTKGPPQNLKVTVHIPDGD